MKKHILLFGALIPSLVFSQAIVNGDFENWSSSSIENLDNYWTSNNEVVQMSLPMNALKVTDAQSGTYAIQLTTVCNASDTMFGYFTNGDPGTGFGGIPIAGSPTFINGYYKSNIAAGDTGLILVILKQNGTQIGGGIFQLYGTHSSYTAFSFPIVSSGTADSVIFAAVSSNAFMNSGICGSMLQLDNVTFSGIATQPPLLNGSFENWTTSVFDDPAGWFVNGDSRTPSVMKSTDSHSGVYAAELVSYSDIFQPNESRNSSLSTGQWVNCPNCTLIGGNPYALTMDTLCFWYKYAPQGGDSAWVYVTFKANGNQISGFGQFLLAASSYTYMAIPFNVFPTPDTVVVQFQSANWTDTLPSSIGSDLKVDDMYFKSSPLSAGPLIPSFSVNVNVFPNPSHGEIFLASNSYAIENVEIYNALGERINAASVNSINGKISIGTSGTYTLRIHINGRVIEKQVVVTE